MLSRKTGNILIGKTPLGENIRISSNGNTTLTQIGNTIRERTVKSLPISDDAETFKEIFPEYNDFRLIIKHDKLSGNRLGTQDKGYLVGVRGDGKETVLMRQNKVNAGYSDIYLNYDTNTSVPVKPNDLESYKSELQIYRPSDFQIRPTLYTKITDEFAKAYLQSIGKLKETENATDLFYKMMRRETGI